MSYSKPEIIVEALAFTTIQSRKKSDLQLDSISFTTSSAYEAED
jgi:hypothetical protein